MNPFEKLNQQIQDSASPLSKREYLTALMLQSLLPIAKGILDGEQIVPLVNNAVLIADLIVEKAAVRKI